MPDALYIDDVGQVVPVGTGTDLERQAHMLGWVPASAEQARDYFLAQKYGSTGQAAIAGLESFGSMVTLGGSTAAEVALGVDPEAIKAREKANPMAGATGSTLGVLVPLLLSGGASGAAQTGARGAVAGAAEMAGPSLLARVGQAVTKVATRELPETASLAERLTAKGLAMAAGGAAEGAGYEVGQLVHESALGDPGLAGEAALARIGLSAATFGALSGGGGVLGQLMKDVAGGTSAAGLRGKLAEWLEELEVRSNEKAAGAIQRDLTKAGKRSGEDRLASLALEMRDLGILRNPLDTPAAVLERAEAIKSRSPVTEILKSADEVAAAEGERLGNLPAAVERARSEILDPLLKDPTEKSAARRFGELLGDYAAKGEGTLQDLHDVRRQLDKVFDLGDPDRTALGRSYRKFRRIVSDEIESGIAKSGMDSDVWREANREYEVASTAADFARSGLKRSGGNNMFGLSSTLGGVAGTVAGGPAGGLLGTIATEAVRRQGSATLGWMARGLRNLLEGGEGAAVANGTAAAVAAERQAGAAAEASVAARASSAPETAATLSVLARAKAKLTEEIDSALKDVLSAAPGAGGRTVARAAARAAASSAEDVAQARRLAQSPELLQDALTRQTDELHHHAPSVAQAVQLSSARRAAFLASKAPAATLPGVLAQRAKPTTYDLAKFGRYREVTDAPLKALAHARRGTLTPEHVEALQVGWPALHQHMQTRFIEALMDHSGKTISPQARMMATMLTGFNLDGAMGFNSIAANQAVYARAPQQGGMGGAIPNPSAAKLNMAKRTATPLQRQSGEGG